MAGAPEPGLTPPPLPSPGLGWRMARVGLGVLPGLALAALLWLPGSGWWTGRFRSWTGLPCPFCGGTRALRALARGDWEAVWYYHPLVPAVVAAALVWAAWWWGEALRGRPWPRAWWVSWVGRLGWFGVVGLGLFWVFHVVLALWVPKPELLDAGGWVWRLWGQ